MKKMYAFIALFLVAMLGTNLPLSAQTTIAGDRIKLSDESATYWYYVENGHNLTDFIADNDGRLGGLMTGYPQEQASTQSIRPNANRNSQKWKVVASDEADYYYIINKDGNYLEFDPADEKKRYNAKISSPANMENCKLKIMQFSPTTTGYFLKMARKGAPANFYVGMFNSGGKNMIYESESTAATVQSNGLTANPRSWRFVPETEMETFYPTIYPSNTAKNDIVEWYYIKSTDKTIADKSYLTIDPSTKKFSMQEKNENPENQLFGFIHRSFVAEAYVTNIIARGTNEALCITSSKLSTGSSAQDWTLRHVFSTNNPEQMMQATFRTARTISGLILTNNVANNLPTFANTYSTYDNQYAWVYEKVPASQLSVTSSEKITILTGADGGTFEYGQSHTITYTAAEGTLPVVKVNGEIATAGTLADGVYTLTTTVTKATTIEISASMPEATITLNYGAGITITSPILDEKNQYSSLSTLTVALTLSKGYSNPLVEAAKATVVEQPTLEAGVYTFKLENIQNGAEISVSATLDQYSVTTSYNDGIVWDNTPADKATYVTPYTAQFKLAEGYHSPLATVNGQYVTLSPLENGIYSYTINNVFDAKKVVVNAFSANELPVAEDLFVDGRQATTTWLYTNAGLQVQYSTGAYTRRSYLSFDASALDVSAFNKATLRMVVRGIDKPTNTTSTNIAAYSVTLTSALKDMTWNNNGESTGNSIKGSIVSPKVSWKPSNVKKNNELRLNVTNHALNSIRDNNGIIRMQVASTDNGDGYFEFYSREGAANETTLDRQPVILFEHLPEVTLTADSRITLTSPSKTGVTVVETGVYSVSFSIEDGATPLVKVDGVDKSSDLRQDNTTYTLSLTNITTDTTIDISIDRATAIDEVETDKVEILTVDQQIVLSSTHGQSVAIYSANGQFLQQVWIDGQAVVALPKGLYFVKSSAGTQKVQL